MFSSGVLITELKKYADLEEEFPIIKFPSLISMAYIHHYKYLQIERKGSESDIPDILMSAVYPYVDIVITERNQCSILKQIQKRHNFLTGLKVISQNQIMSEK